MNDPIHKAQEPAKQEPLTFSALLEKSGIPYVQLFGSFMQFFGPKAVVAFALGISATYAYAAIRNAPPPFFPSPPASTTSAEPMTVTLNGQVKTWEGEPLEEFNIGVIRTQQFSNPGGAFQLEVPEKGAYELLVWQPGSKTYRIYGYQKPEKKGAGQYELPFPLDDFPTKLGFVQGTAKDLSDNPIKGVVEIEGKRAQIGRDGTFKVTNIPIGKTKIRVYDADHVEQPWEEELQIDINGLTNSEIQVRK